jgi:hypothetical protein
MLCMGHHSYARRRALVGRAEVVIAALPTRRVRKINTGDEASIKQTTIVQVLAPRANASSNDVATLKASQNRNRQTLRSFQRVRAVTQALDRRTYDRLVEPLPPTGQGLGESQSQRSRFPQTRFHPPHVAKAMQSLIKSPDGLLSAVAWTDKPSTLLTPPSSMSESMPPAPCDRHKDQSKGHRHVASRLLRRFHGSNRMQTKLVAATQRLTKNL